MGLVEFTPVDITTEDQLFQILKDLRGQGWRGQLSTASDADDPSGESWRLQVAKEPTAPGGVKSQMEGHIGDKKVTFNGIVSVLTQADYTAMYGDV